ncbi:MAG: sigma-54 dependent transcriptional regulator [Candidatus Margulisiibacteriota bacterium]
MHSILVVDDELSIRESFSLILEDKYKVLLAASGEAALKTATDQKVDIVYLDIRMPGLDGLETLKRIKEIDPGLEIIMVTAVNDVQKANQAIKLGARDYIVKPFDVHNVLKLTEQILRRKSILIEGSEVQKKTAKNIPEMIGQNEKIIEIQKSIDKIKKDERVLIFGEAGTEKEMVARIIHEKSDRTNFPFRSIYLSHEMSPLETKTMLFGRSKGTTTIDLEAKIGLLEENKNGTLFINNLESLPEEIFKTISSLKFSRLGPSSHPIPLEARLIGGTNTDLTIKNKGLFDFFSAVLIQIPPLRERGSDIPLLANHLIEKYNISYGRAMKITPPALDAFANYPWPGNTQELESLMERLVLSCSNNEIVLEDLPIHILLKTSQGAGSSFISIFEKEYIQSIFEKSGKSKEKTAAFLGVNPILLETKI